MSCWQSSACTIMHNCNSQFSTPILILSIATHFGNIISEGNVQPSNSEVCKELYSPHLPDIPGKTQRNLSFDIALQLFYACHAFACASVHACHYKTTSMCS